jgi:hypothetical protein
VVAGTGASYLVKTTFPPDFSGNFPAAVMTTKGMTAVSSNSNATLYAGFNNTDGFGLRITNGAATVIDIATTGNISNANNTANSIGGVVLNQRVISNLLSTTYASGTLNSSVQQTIDLSPGVGVFFCYMKSNDLNRAVSTVISGLGSDGIIGGTGITADIFYIQGLFPSRVRFYAPANSGLYEYRIYAYFLVAS